MDNSFLEEQAARCRKLADIAVWRVDELGGAGGFDPLWTVVFGGVAPLELLVINGKAVVEHGTLVTADASALARAATSATTRVLGV